MGNNTNAIGKTFEVFASKTLAQATEPSFVAAHPAAICFTPDGQIVFGGDVYSQQKTWTGSQEEYEAIALKDANTTYYVNSEEDVNERRVYVGETLVLGGSTDYDFTGLLYGLSSMVEFTFCPKGKKNDGVKIRRRTDNTFKAKVGDVEALGTAFFIDDNGAVIPVLKEISTFPTIVGNGTNLFYGQNNLEVVAEGALRSSYAASVEETTLNNEAMFRYCYNLKSIDISGLEYLGNASYMFSDCTSLKSVKLPQKFGQSCSYMFYGCSNLNFEVFLDNNSEIEGLKYIGYMFSGCTNLTGNEDGVFFLSSNFKAVVNADSAFRETRFKILRVDGGWLFGLDNASIRGLFYGNNLLESVESPINAPGGVGQWSLNESYSPFWGCENLVYATIRSLGKNSTNIPLCGAPKWGSEDDMQCVKDTLINYSEVNSLSSGAFVLLDQAVADRLSEDDKAQITAKGISITTI